MSEGATLVADRALIAVTGDDAQAFLNRLVTNSVTAAAARFAALLTPQGKIIADFFAVPLPGGGFLLEAPAPQATELVRRLMLQKLRAKVEIEDRSAALAVAAVWGGPAPRIDGAIVFADPRNEGMGRRLVGPGAALAGIGADAAAYTAHRVRQGVPQGGLDFAYGDSFVQEANLDHDHGVDFDKGCYVGQEVVARVHFRRSARKRIVKARFSGPPPATGDVVVAGETQLGTIGSVATGQTLALMRLDKLEEARAAGLGVAAGGVALDVEVPAAFLDRAGLKAAS